MSFTPYDIPPQENKGKWFKSHLLGREIELGELYSLGSNDLDLLMAETLWRRLQKSEVILILRKKI